MAADAGSPAADELQALEMGEVMSDRVGGAEPEPAAERADARAGTVLADMGVNRPQRLEPLRGQIERRERVHGKVSGAGAKRSDWPRPRVHANACSTDSIAQTARPGNRTNEENGDCAVFLRQKED